MLFPGGWENHGTDHPECDPMAQTGQPRDQQHPGLGKARPA